MSCADHFHRAPTGLLEPYRLVAPDGKRTAKGGPSLAEAEQLFRWVVFGRVFDQRMISLQRQGRIGTIGSIRGQEASAAGIAMAMEAEDWLVASYRELLAYIVHGVPVTTIVNLYRGKVPGPFPDDVKAMPIQIVIGSQMPHAAGIAAAMKLRGDKAVAVCCCGDGATSEGDFHEGLNFAGVYQAPAVFFVQNNEWAISVPRERQTKSETIAQKAWAYGLTAVVVDGNDALAVYEVGKEAIRRARSGEGPVLIEALTYRVGPHTTSDDPRRYRDEAIAKAKEALDPVLRLRRFLEAEGAYKDGLQEALEEEARAHMSEAVEAVENAPAFTPDEMFDLTYAKPTPRVDEDRRAALGRLSGEDSR